MRKANESAFPSSVDPAIRIPGDGLTKRELIAAMAMQGFLSSPRIPVDQSTGNVCEKGYIKNRVYAENSVLLADALLAALKAVGHEVGV